MIYEQLMCGFRGLKRVSHSDQMLYFLNILDIFLNTFNESFLYVYYTIGFVLRIALSMPRTIPF